MPRSITTPQPSVIASSAAALPWAASNWFPDAGSTSLGDVASTPVEAVRPSFERITPPPSSGGRSGEASPTDESAALVGRAREGDRLAFRRLFERHRADVARLVYRMVGPRSEIDDLVQEVFVQVHRSLRDFRGDARFSTWLHRVTVNVVLMHRRAVRSRPVLTEELPPGTLEDESCVQPDEEADRRKRVLAFLELVQQVADKKRVVFVLHDLEGVSPQEISEIVDAPVLTVRTRLFYARRELEEKMRAHPLLGSIVEREGGFAGLTGSARRGSK